MCMRVCKSLCVRECVYMWRCHICSHQACSVARVQVPRPRPVPVPPTWRCRAMARPCHCRMARPAETQAAAAGDGGGGARTVRPRPRLCPSGPRCSHPPLPVRWVPRMRTPLDHRSAVRAIAGPRPRHRYVHTFGLGGGLWGSAGSPRHCRTWGRSSERVRVLLKRVFDDGVAGHTGARMTRLVSSVDSGAASGVCWCLWEVCRGMAGAGVPTCC